MSNPYSNPTSKMSVLGPTLVFRGELSADEDLMLRGRVEGSIQHTATLRIGEEGSVKGDIKAKYITVEGRVEGDLHATGSITIRETATVEGNVYAPVVSLLEGAHFKGSIDMGDAPRSARAQTPESSQGSSSDDAESAQKVAAGAN
jgi:cytoskeletal protein CcmA (bactofilin family)